MTGVIFIIQNGQLIELKEQPQHQADCIEIASEPDQHAPEARILLK